MKTNRTGQTISSRITRTVKKEIHVNPVRLLRTSAIAATALLTFWPNARAALISYYPFDGNPNDAAGTRNGTLLGDATYSSNVPPGFSGQSLSLDGTFDKMVYDVTGGDAVGGSFTVAMWVNPAELRPQGSQNFFGTRGPVDGSIDIKFRTDNSVNYKIRLDLGNGNAFSVIHDTPTFTFTLGRWYHVAVAVSPSSWNIYLDGSLLDSGVGPAAPVLWDANHDLAIGSINATTGPQGPPLGEDFHGLIDDVRIYSTALTATEVKALVPEPQAICLLALGFLASGIAQRKRRTI